jgi:hypothetical protein
MHSHRFIAHASSYTGRAVVFLFLLSVLACFFFVLGNYQDFLDSTQIFLLSLLRASLSMELAAGVWLAGFLVHRAVRLHRPFVIRSLLLLASMALSATLLVMLRYAQQWLQS